MSWSILWRHLRWCDGPVSLLSSRIPDLGLDGLALHMDTACGKLHPDGALALQVELISGEAREQVTLAHTRVSNQNHCRWQGQRCVRSTASTLWCFYIRYCVCYWPWRHTWHCKSSFKQIPFVRWHKPASLHHTIAIKSQMFHTQRVCFHKAFNNERKGHDQRATPFFTHTGRLMKYWECLSSADRGNNQMDIIVKLYLQLHCCSGRFFFFKRN